MKRFFSKTLAMLMVIALIMSFAAISASADENGEGESGGESEGTTAFTGYTPLTILETNDKIAMTKFLVMDSDAYVPAISFQYTISPASYKASQPATDTKPATVEILAGPTATNAPKVVAASFTGGETTTNGLPTDAAGSATNGKKYAKANALIDLTGVTFTKPGVYRYTIIERNDGIAGISYDSSATRYLDVFVITDENDVSKLKISGTKLSKTLGEISAVDGEYIGSDVKSDGYVNTLTSHNLTFEKEITGNQADKSKRFKFELTLTNVNPGSYALDLTDVQEMNDSNVSIPAADTITVDSTRNITKTFYLTNASSVTIKELNSGATYTITESPEDYTPSVGSLTGGAAVKADSNNSAVTGTLNNTDATAKFTNTRTGVIPTGVLLTVAPFAIGMLLFGAIAFFLISKKRREDY